MFLNILKRIFSLLFYLFVFILSEVAEKLFVELTTEMTGVFYLYCDIVLMY